MVTLVRTTSGDCAPPQVRVSALNWVTLARPGSGWYKYPKRVISAHREARAVGGWFVGWHAEVVVGGWWLGWSVGWWFFSFSVGWSAGWSVANSLVYAW